MNIPAHLEAIRNRREALLSARFTHDEVDEMLELDRRLANGLSTNAHSVLLDPVWKRQNQLWDIANKRRGI